MKSLLVQKHFAKLLFAYFLGLYFLTTGNGHKSFMCNDVEIDYKV